MKPQSSLIDIPIKSAVIAWQPQCCSRSADGAAPGDVAIFRPRDLGELAYHMTDGASYSWWAEQSDAELITQLNMIKRLMVRTHRIPLGNVEAAYSCIPEYRKWRDSSR
jgi:hypothetical protein